MYIDKNGVKIIERGWAGHFICADECLFRRNTLLEKNKLERIIVSTVGNQKTYHDKAKEIGHNRYYETMVFIAELKNGYWDAQIDKQIDVDEQWTVPILDILSDEVANNMHDVIVMEISNKLKNNLIKSQE